MVWCKQMEGGRQRPFNFYSDFAFSLRRMVLRLSKLEQKYLIGSWNEVDKKQLSSLWLLKYKNLKFLMNDFIPGH